MGSDDESYVLQLHTLPTVPAQGVAEGERNRQEALREMIDGAKVRHEYFTSEEYLIMDVWGKIKTEDGYDFADQFFGNDWFATGWSVVKTKFFF